MRSSFLRPGILPAILPALLGLTVLSLRTAYAQSQQRVTSTLAIVVDPRSGITELSAARLRRIFAGEQQFWQNGDRITLLVPQKGTRERTATLRAIYNMTESEFTRFWISRTFGDHIVVAPKLMPSVAATINALQSYPGAIGVVVWPVNDAGARAVAIDGRKPGEPGYPLIVRHEAR